MASDKAEEIARGLKWLGQSFAEAGMARDAARAARDSQWWMTYAISLAQQPPAARSVATRQVMPQV